MREARSKKYEAPASARKIQERIEAGNNAFGLLVFVKEDMSVSEVRRKRGLIAKADC